MNKVNEKPNKPRLSFRHLAERASFLLGSSGVFFIALVLILSWAAGGFFFEFNDTWQLLINTVTSIGTFLMVILVQNTQTREARSIQLKLDELVRGTKSTRNIFLDIEDQSDEEMAEFEREFKQLRAKYLSRHKHK